MALWCFSPLPDGIRGAEAGDSLLSTWKSPQEGKKKKTKTVTAGSDSSSFENHCQVGLNLDTFTSAVKKQPVTLTKTVGTVAPACTCVEIYTLPYETE